MMFASFLMFSICFYTSHKFQILALVMFLGKNINEWTNNQIMFSKLVWNLYVAFNAVHSLYFGIIKNSAYWW